jgi:hypothetical protein
MSGEFVYILLALAILPVWAAVIKRYFYQGESSTTNVISDIDEEIASLEERISQLESRKRKLTWQRKRVS